MGFVIKLIDLRRTEGEKSVKVCQWGESNWGKLKEEERMELLLQLLPVYRVVYRLLLCDVLMVAVLLGLYYKVFIRLTCQKIGRGGSAVLHK